MPILKVISGHTSVRGIKNYLEKDGRALAQDFYNLSWDERDMAGYDEAAKAFVPWDEEMDRTRAKHDHDREWRGLKARTFKHFVLSPDPQDHIDLPALRELTRDWAQEHFDDFQIAITYHDDNEHHIPHAHIVVNCTNLRTGYKLHTDHPEDLNKELQRMAVERGLRGLSNEQQAKTGAEKLAAMREERKGVRMPPRTRQAVYIGHAERGIAEIGGWSWISDIRSRVSIAKTLAKSEAEFRELLDALEVNIADNSAKARRDDWIFSLVDEPTKKVSGERLGLSFGKQSLQHRFARLGAYRPSEAAVSVLRARAEGAVELNDLLDLDDLSHALETCARFSIRSLEDFDKRLESKSVAASLETQLELMKARNYMAENKLLPQRIAAGAQPSNARTQRAGKAQDAAVAMGRNARQQTSQDAAAHQRKAAQVQQEEQQRQQRQKRKDR